MTLTNEQRLHELTFRLGEVYEKYKEFDKALNGEDKKKKNRQTGVKEEFLDVVAEVVASGTLAQKTVVVEADSAEEAELEAKKRNPRWLVLATKFDDNLYRVTIEEDPYYKPFTFVNTRTKMVFTKSVVDGSSYLDDETLREKDPALWARVSTLDNEDFIRELLYHANVEDVDDFIAGMEANYETKRTLKPLGELTSDDLAALEDYIYPGKPTVKLAAPRKAKPEELDA